VALWIGARIPFFLGLHPSGLFSQLFDFFDPYPFDIMKEQSQYNARKVT